MPLLRDGTLYICPSFALSFDCQPNFILFRLLHVGTDRRADLPYIYDVLHF